MSQQQDSQESSSQFEDYEEQYPLSSPWRIQGKGRTHEGPKSEHPSTYDESIPPLSYRARDQGRASSSPASPKVGASPATTHKTSSKSSKMTNRPYSQYTGGWQIPLWAKPPQNNFGTIPPFVLLIMGVILFPVILYLIVKVIIPLIALLALIILVVLIILGVLLLAFVIIAVLWAIGKIDRIKPPSWW